MTAQEQQMIDGLVDRIRNTPVADKDLAAEQRLQQGLAGVPDALYVLAQTVLVQQYGLQQAQAQLQQAQAQIAQLQAQRQAQPQPAPSTGGSFLSHLFGSAAQPQTPPYQPVNNPTYAPAYAQPAYPPAYAQPVTYAPAGGGFLRSAMQTAAGVAAGEMAFAGMESLFHGFGGGGYGGGFGGGYEGGHPEEIIKNYYDDNDRADHHQSHEDRGHEDIDREDTLHNADYISNDDTTPTDDGFDSPGTDTFDSGTDTFDSSTDDFSSGDDGTNSF